MRKKLFTILLVLGGYAAWAQNVGLSFSYFIPRNGYFSTPISPFSIRGVGFDINQFLALETGATLYRMSGLNVRDTPLDTKEPITGANFTVFVPVELVLQFGGSRATFDIKAGAFGFVGFSQKINYGNLDRALRTNLGWDVANATVSHENNPGFGWQTGAELTVYLNRQLGVSLEVNYLAGQSNFPLQGSVIGGVAGSPFQTAAINYPDAKLDFTGLEIAIGIILSGR